MMPVLRIFYCVYFFLLHGPSDKDFLIGVVLAVAVVNVDEGAGEPRTKLGQLRNDFIFYL